VVVHFGSESVLAMSESKPLLVAKDGEIEHLRRLKAYQP
jgi:hypothetical protein